MTRCIPKPLRICAYTQPLLILLFHIFCIVTITFTCFEFFCVFVCVLVTFLLDLQRAEIFATERDLAFVQTSAKTGFNIDRLFHDIGKSNMSVLTADT